MTRPNDEILRNRNATPTMEEVALLITTLYAIAKNTATTLYRNLDERPRNLYETLLVFATYNDHTQDHSARQAKSQKEKKYEAAISALF